MYRKFTLINSKDEYWELANPNNRTFAGNPSGLGYSNTKSFIRIGDMDMETYSQFSLSDITFAIVFYQDTNSQIYSAYSNFVKFLMHEPITLKYDLPNGKSYQRKCAVGGISKTEVDSSNSAMSCNLTLKPQEMWLGEAKTVEFSNTPLVQQFTCESGIPTPLLLEFNGKLTNPKYTLYDADDNEIGVGRFIGTFAKMVIDSEDGYENIQLRLFSDSSKDVVNPYGYQDLTVVNYKNELLTFIKASVGLNKIKLETESSADGWQAKVTYIERFASV